MRRMAFFAVLLLGLDTFAQVSLGVDLRWAYLRSSDEQGNRIGTDNVLDLSVFPSVIIAPSDRIEFVPFGGFFFSHTWGETEQDGVVVSERENTFSGFGAGMGLFFRLFNREIIRFSVGPELAFTLAWDDDDYFRFNWELSAPVNIDILFSDRFFIRMSESVASINMTLYDYDNNRNRTEFGSIINSRVTPSIGFYFTF